MTPTPPQPDDVHVAERVAATIELWAKIAGSAGIIAGFLKLIVKPFIEWRRESQARMVRDVLAPELEKMHRIIETEDGCARRMEVVLHSLREFFGDHDHLIAIATDNRDRLDEFNDLLSALGFSSERREDDERRLVIDRMITALTERRKARRRGMHDPHELILEPERDEARE